MNVTQYLSNLEKVINGLDNQFEKIIIDNSEQIADLNREKQLFQKGENAKGERLKEYTDKTKLKKKSKGQPFDRTTLKDKGDVFKNFKVKYDNNKKKIYIFSSDEKTLKLILKYGKEIFGLNTENNKYLQNEILFKNIKIWIKSKL